MSGFDAQSQPSKPLTYEDFTKSDAYHINYLIPEDPILEAAKKNSHDNGLPEIAVSTSQGKFLHLTAKSIGAKRILEVGTLGGYSAIWLARALPEGGKLTTLEISEKHAQVAKANIAKAGLSDKVEVILGPAIESIKKLDPSPPFDLVFIDADKTGNLDYYLEAKRLTRKGAVIMVDNVVRHGKVASYPDDTDNSGVLGVRRLLKHLESDKEVDATTLQLVGEKGYDGILYSVKL